MIRHTRFAALLALPLLLAACNDEEEISGPTLLEVTGSYSLATINNQPLPYILEQTPDYVYEVTHINITLNEDETFTDEAVYRLTEGTEVTVDTTTGAGTFVVKNKGRLEMSYFTGELLIGTADGNSLRFGGGNFTFIFQRDD